MSGKTKNPPAIEDLISTGEDTLGSSISLSIGENSIRIKERAKVKDQNPAPVVSTNIQDKWWLKKPEVQLGLSSPKRLELKVKSPQSPSPDVSASMAEFLEKEKLCKASTKSNGKSKDKDDTLCDILASAAFDKYPSDFENATDEDIGSILQEMSEIAGALSPNSGPEYAKSGNNSKNPTEEERSVEELLQEAVNLVKKNNSNISKSNSKSDTLVPEIITDANDSLVRVRQLEDDIFQMIQAEVHKETEKIKRSPKAEHTSDTSPGLEIVFENLNVVQPAKDLELQVKKFDEHKVEVSSSSDLDDPIERHSKSEERVRKEDVDKENLRKEITDVDKDFFEKMMKKSMGKSEGGMSGSSSFGQDDFSHFLRMLQGQSDKNDEARETKSSNLKSSPMFSLSKTFVHLSEKSGVKKDADSIKSPAFPEREINEVLERELMQSHKADPKIESDTNLSARKSPRSEVASKTEVTLSRNSSVDSGASNSSKKDAKVVNSKSELYTVGLTPRLELFADAIPKLIAEKSNENLRKQEQEKLDKEKKPDVVVESKAKHEEVVNSKAKKTYNNDRSKSVDKSGANTDTLRIVNIQKNILDSPKNDRQSVTSENEVRREFKFGKSKSCDQIPKSASNLKLAADNAKPPRSTESSRKPPVPILKKSPILKPKSNSKPFSKFTSKIKLSPKPKKEIAKSVSTSSLAVASKKPDLKSADNLLKHNLAGGDTNRNLSKSDWESLCKEERHKNYLLKQQLDSEAKIYKTQIEGMRTSFEEELFSLRKHNIILKAKVDELSLNERRSEIKPKPDTKVLMLERELEKQQSLLQAYERENKKLMTEAKEYQEKMKNLQSKQKVTVDATENQELIDQMKDLQEQTLKLNLEVANLREKNNNYAMKNEDLGEQNSLLKDELDMFKNQLKTKNNYITDKLHAMSKSESALRKELEDLKVELNSKSEQLRGMKSEYDATQRNLLPLEEEILQLRVHESQFNEKMQIAKSHIEREKQLSQKLKDQVIIDNKKIMDLNRQIREMERILKRKNPDSLSALILTANSEHERINADKVKLLEERIVALETEIRVKEETAQEKLADLQRKFAEMKERYANQVIELEEKLLEYTVTEQKIYKEASSQTICRNTESKSLDPSKKEERDRVAFAERDDRREAKQVKVGPKTQNVKEDTHLIATIRGLKLELSNKDKTVLKLTKDFQELQKTNRRLQKEREKLLNDKKTCRNMDIDKMSRSTGSDSRPTSSKASDLNDQNSNCYQNGNLSNSNANQRLTGSTQKLYNPLQFSENNDNYLTKKLINENEILKEELDKMNKDFMALKNKRLHDLNLLQEEHEREIASIVKEYSVKFGDSKIVKLQGQLNTQMAIISHLKQQIEKLRDYKEQVIVLKTEREHLENKVRILTEKVKYLSTPGTEQLQLLQDKITVLQQRHESRETTLQSLVRDLLRTKTQCRDCKGEKGKNKQLCFFRQELDNILDMLQEIANVY